MKSIRTAAALVAIAAAVAPWPALRPAPEQAATLDVALWQTNTTTSNTAVEQLAGRLVAHFPCASDPWSEGNPNHMSFGLEQPGGWQRFTANYVRHAIADLGYRRVFFHLPLGKPTGQSPYEVHLRETGIADESLDQWHMGLDQVDHLRRTGQGHVLTDMIEAFDTIHDAAPDVEIIVYVGSYDKEDLHRFESNLGSHAFGLWLESLAPFLERPYVSIVFDNLVGKDEDHPNARFAQLARWHKTEQGGFVGAEARFQKQHTWLNDWGFTCVAGEATWRMQAHSGNIPLAWHRAEVIRILDGHSTDLVYATFHGDWVQAAANITWEGCVPAVQTPYEFEHYTAEDLAAELLERSKRHGQGA
ncbi:MAG: hypothetical protein DHS20C14_02490 [Phycisphaeraceae bacterium]|nr:MAG: hypothetical protein DHS20C14_02490 [Phycisphaeraceae bacterium]